MKKILFIALFFGFKNINAQHEHFCSKAKINAFKSQMALNQKPSSTLGLISHEKNYDIKFVHMNLNVERTTKFVSGNVRSVALVTSTTLDTFACLLHQNHTVDSIYINGVKCASIRKDSIIKAKTPSTLSNGQTLDVTVYYKGNPPVGGAAIGNGFSNGFSGAWGNQVTWSLSESLAAYHWWPCKQICTDKIDSSWVFVTTDSTNKVGSNGLLKNTVIVGNKKRYEWKSQRPIDYYLISVAVAKYKEYRIYAKPQYLINDSILIQNYIYDNAINASSFINGQKIDLDLIKQTMELECNLFGMYPFYKEKYGHCMAPFGGGMEHQTMTSLGFFDFYVDAHELGHQWWGDNVTCKSWGDIWMNEGFASYTEHLVAQYIDLPNFAPNLQSAHASVMGQPGGSIYFTNHDTVDATRIFSSRLTYDKGGSIIRTMQFEVNNDSTWFNGLRGFQNTFKYSTASTVDFKTYMETFTGKNFTQFFNQWYYGEGYPTFNVKWSFVNNTVYLQSAQSTSSATSVPLFITPMEYKLTRSGAPDTVIRVMHNAAVQNYSYVLTGTVTGVVIDPNNWVINDGSVTNDQTIGMEENLAKQTQISISPNPTNGIINITIPNQTKGNAEVYDVTGKLIYKESLKDNLKIDLSNKEAAVYSVVLKDEKGATLKTEKIIKQ